MYSVATAFLSAQMVRQCTEAVFLMQVVTEIANESVHGKQCGQHIRDGIEKEIT